MPGMLRRLPWWLLDPEGPLVVRWSNLPASLPWLLRWIRAGRIERVEQHARALRALHAPSYGRYQRLLGPRAAGLIEMTGQLRSEEQTSELQSLMRTSYAVYCLKKKLNTNPHKYSSQY